jgi:gliding motility-associated-like protein
LSLNYGPGKFLPKLYFLVVFILLITAAEKTVAQCPPNIDFEQGDFSGWQCYSGTIEQNTGTLILNPTAPVANRHTMLSATLPGNGIDFWGGFPQNCPNGSGHSIRLGNSTAGRGAEKVSYTFTIPPTQNTFSLIYNYAIVLQDFGHTAVQQPRLTIEVLNLTDNVVDPCSSFDFVVGANLPGFYDSPESTPSVPVRCKDWSAASINLDGKAGKTIKISFTTTDCSQGVHFGYAYVDINAQCGNSFIGTTFCPNDTAVSVTAPFGYQNYQWLNSSNQVLGTQQTLTLKPPPASGTIVSVELTPYNGYGCVTTLVAELLNTLTVSADAGPDNCDVFPVRIGGPPQPGLVYKWSPATGLSNPDISNPIASPLVNTQYTLTVSSTGGGCIATDVVNVNTKVLSDSIQLIGAVAICRGSGQSTSLKVFPADGIQWFKDDIAIPGANQTILNVSQTGAYYAVLSNTTGCTRTTAVKQIDVFDSPAAAFTINLASQCFEGNQFIFTNGSSVPVGALQYSWQLDDGTTLGTKDITYNYLTTGNYTIKLVATGLGGCKDSTSRNVIVIPTPSADFTVQPVCENLPVPLFNTTFNNTTSTINYLWDFGNGHIDNAKTPVYSYPLGGNYTIKLTVSTVQCPAAFNTKAINVDIEQQLPGIIYAVKDAAFNFPEPLNARPIGNSITWTPPTSLTNRFSFTPSFKGLMPQLYTIEIKTAAGCVTVDTQLVKTHKKIEIYVPTGFTVNGDGINDYLRPLLIGFTKVNYFRIYNRWGKLLFSMNSDYPGWDGKINNIPADIQTVVWMIEAVDVDGIVHNRQGTTVLFR